MTLLSNFNRQFNAILKMKLVLEGKLSKICEKRDNEIFFGARIITQLRNGSKRGTSHRWNENYASSCVHVDFIELDDGNVSECSVAIVLCLMVK